MALFDEGGQIRLVGDREEDGQRADGEGDAIEIVYGMRAEEDRDGDRGEQQRATYVGEEEDGSPPHAIDPDACEEAEQERGGVLDSAEDTHLRGRRVQCEGGGEREGEASHLRADQGDGLTGPELEKVGVAPEAFRRC